MGNIIEKIKKYEFTFFIFGILIIISGISLDILMPWIDQINLTVIEICIADMHFRHNNETQFQECVTPDLKKIEGIQQISAIITILYSMGGVFVGLGFRKKS